jgi:hypothetical protein
MTSIRDGTRVGELVAPGGLALPLRVGEAVDADGVAVAAALDPEDRVVAFCLVPPGLRVTSRGRRQIGAFLMDGGGSFEAKARAWMFRPDPRALVAFDGTCAFCHAPVRDGTLILAGGTRYAGRVLCQECASAGLT